MKSNTKVIQVSTIAETANALLRPQCDYLRDIGYDVSFVFSPDQQKKEKLTSVGFKVHEQYISRQIAASDMLSIINLARYFRQIKPTIVHTHTSKAGVVGRLAARLAGVPYIIHTIHGFPFIEGQNPFKFKMYVNIERWAAGLTDVCLSQSMEDVITARSLGIMARQGEPVHISNGVDIQRFDCRHFEGNKDHIIQELGIEQGPIITIIGRQTIEKGYIELISALGQLSNYKWTALFIGPDEGAGDLIKENLEKHEISDRVLILGRRTDIDRLLAITDIYVLPSYREGVPRSVIEAQAMGVPAIVTNIRGCREIVKEGVNGYLVPPRDSDNLAIALGKLLDNSRLRGTMGIEARRIVEEQFDEQKVFERIAVEYEKLLQR